MSELMECPFPTTEIVHVPRVITAVGESWVLCTCGASGPMFSDVDGSGEQKAIDAWNTRAERTCHPVEKFNEESPWPKLVCSECGRPLHVDDAVDENGIEYSELQPYCGCGARVERGESCHAVSWGLNEDAEWEIKLSCGHSVYDEEPDFCPECGVRITR